LKTGRLIDGSGFIAEWTRQHIIDASDHADEEGILVFVRTTPERDEERGNYYYISYADGGVHHVIIDGGRMVGFDQQEMHCPEVNEMIMDREIFWAEFTAETTS
jgi:hypothetical protein